MNYNVLFIVMDGCRFDTFEKANTPNFDRIGKLYKAYSPSAGTAESYISYVYGGPPLGLPDEYIDSLYWKEFRDPNCFWKKKPDAYTFMLTGNPPIADISNLFSDSFDTIEFKRYRRIGDRLSISCGDIFKDCVNLTKDKEKFFGFLWLMETHHPYSTDKVLPFNHIMKPEVWKRNQQLSIEFIDSKLGKLLDYLESRDDKTLVIALADHGDMMGEEVDGKQRWHHSIFNKQLRVTFHPKLFEIPYIQGIINE